MDFTQIRLSFSELRILRRSRKRPVPLSKCRRLLRLRLVTELTRMPFPGGMPVGIGVASISDLGEDFLAYRRSDLSRNYLRPVVVSFLTALATALATHWLWPLLQQGSKFLFGS